LALHFGILGGFLGLPCNAGRQVQALGQLDSQSRQERVLGGVWLHDASQADGPPVRCRKRDIGAMNLGQFVEHLPWAATESRCLAPSFESLLQRIGQKADQNVGLDPMSQAVPDGTQP
jgi:hypothetical protein